MRYLRVVLVALALGAWAAGPLSGAASARLLAPTYQSSEPGKGEMMDEPPEEVRVTFSEPLDPSSWMNVLDECGNEIDSGPAEVQLNEMTVGIGKTPSGMYEVVYRAVGIAGGATGSSSSSFEFMVHNGKPCKGGGGHDHDRKKKHEKKHDRHDDHRDDDHQEHDAPGPTDHSGHSGMTGMGASGHSGHVSMGSGAGNGDGHGAGHGNHHGNGGRGGPGGGGPANPPLATGPTSSPLRADAEAVLIGLSLALAVGVLGGWLLRVSSPPASAR